MEKWREGWKLQQLTELSSRMKDYDSIGEKFEALRSQSKAMSLFNAKIIAATTSCAARYYNLIAAAGPTGTITAISVIMFDCMPDNL